MNKLAAALTRKIDELDVNQSVAGKEIGIDRSTVCKIANGSQATISNKTLNKLTRFLGEDAHELWRESRRDPRTSDQAVGLIVQESGPGTDLATSCLRPLAGFGLPVELIQASNNLGGVPQKLIAVIQPPAVADGDRSRLTHLAPLLVPLSYAIEKGARVFLLIASTLAPKATSDSIVKRLREDTHSRVACFETIDDLADIFVREVSPWLAK